MLQIAHRLRRMRDGVTSKTLESPDKTAEPKELHVSIWKCHL